LNKSLKPLYPTPFLTFLLACANKKVKKGVGVHGKAALANKNKKNIK